METIDAKAQDPCANLRTMTFKEVVLSALSEDGHDISYARCICTVIVLWFLIMDSWYFHRTGQLVDYSVMLAEIGAAGSFYFGNKGAALFNK